MRFLYLLLLLLGAAVARVDITVHSCLDMQVESRDELLHFSVALALQDSTGGSEMVPVLGFEPYIDSRLESRGSCGNVQRGTTALNLVEANAVSYRSYESLITQHDWQKQTDAETGVVQLSLDIAMDALMACEDSLSAPVLRANTDGSYTGVFYISLVQAGPHGEGYVDYGVYTQPHQFRLSSAGAVLSVTPMRFSFDLEWSSNTWTANGDVMMEFASRLSRMTPGRKVGAHFDTVEVSGSSGTLTLVAISECLASSNNTVCEQQWFFMSRGTPAGSHRLTGHVTEDAFGPSVSYTATLNLDAVAPQEQNEAKSGVDMVAFMDEDMQLPYIAGALNASVLRNGDTVCMLLQDNEGHAISAKAARVCTSASQDLASESGQADSGCNTPGVDDIIEAVIFDNDEGFLSHTMRPIIKELDSYAHQAFCFSALKLSENNHVVEVEYEEPGDPGVYGRQLQSFGYDNRNCHRQMYMECERDHEWNRGCNCCRQNDTDDTFWASAWIWGFFFIFIVLLCIAACFSGWDGYWGDGHYDYGYSGHSSNTYQQQQQQTHYRSHNTTHNNYYGNDGGRLPVQPMYSEQRGTVLIDANDTAEIRAKRARGRVDTV